MSEVDDKERGYHSDQWKNNCETLAPGSFRKEKKIAWDYSYQEPRGAKRRKRCFWNRRMKLRPIK